MSLIVTQVLHYSPLSTPLVTGKDGQGGSSNAEKLAGAVIGLLSVEGGSDPPITIERNLIDNLADGLATFIGYSGSNIGDKGIAVGRNGKKDKPWNNVMDAKQQYSGYSYYNKGYIMSYPQDRTWSSDFTTAETDYPKAARIFISCVPLYYYGLGFLFFKCRQSKSEGGWSDHSLNGDKDLTYFLRSQGFGREELRDDKKTGSHVVSSALNTFSEFNGAKTTLKNFVEFLRKLDSNLSDAIKGESKSAEKLKEHSLSAFFLASSAYFTHKRSINPHASHQPPSTLRTMLYWLSGLMITPQFGELLDHFSTIVPADFKVAVSGLAGGSGLQLLSDDDLVGHLVRVCLSCSNVLSAIQGTKGSDNPLLHGVFINTENLQYPSVSSALLRNISAYTYALQFQLGFLYRQCRYDYDKAGGWEKCKYGNGVSDNNVQSHLCNNHSPCALQAFLTDKLPGFSRTIPGSISTHLSECSGVTCHVPMGFNGHLKGDQKTGETIYDTLAYFCGDSKDSLNQLCNKLSCLTKRTPRSLGDLFGFTWQLTGQLFNKTQTLEQLKKAITPNHYSVEGFVAKLTQCLTQVPPQSSPEESGIVKSLQTMAPKIPFLYQMFTVKPGDFLPVTLFHLAQHCHKVEQSHSTSKILHQNSSGSVITSGHDCSGFPADLWSLCKAVGPKTSQYGDTDPYKDCRDKDCGGYLSPLTHTFGSTFAPMHASSYLSWLLYLTNDFETGLRGMLDDFRNIDCKNSGCKPRNTGTCSCPKGHHGTSGGSTCSCESVVQCGGVLPLLYCYGFQFYNPYWLNDSTAKRSCQKFHNALSKVLSPNAPLDKIIATIDSFLYAIRWEFFSKLSGFWTIYMCLILYTFFFLLDTLHLRSHLKITSSHVVPPLALLTAGQPLPITKLTYIGQ